MRFLHTSDWHLGRTIRGVSRADEHRSVLSEIVQIARSRDVDMTIVAGDLFDTATPGPESEEIAWSTLLELADVGPVVVVAGNHDNPRRLEAVAPLLRLGRVSVAGRITAPETGGLVRFEDLGAAIALVPWQSQRGIVSAADLMTGDGSDHSADFAGRMARILARLCEDMTVDTVNIVAGHLTAHGAERSGSERSVHTVIDYSIPTSVFPGSSSYVALGHFHRPQRIPSASPVWYSGSPLQLDFGEAGEQKVVNLVEAEPGLPAEVESVPLRSGRTLTRLVGTLEQVEAAAQNLDPSSHVRVELDEPARVGLADAVRAVVPGVVDVVLRTSEQRRSSRAAPARLGRDPATLFAEYLESIDVADERLTALFGELLEDAHEA